MAEAATVTIQSPEAYDWQWPESEFSGYSIDETVLSDNEIIVDDVLLSVIALGQQLYDGKPWKSADDVPVLRTAREKCDTDSERLLAERQQLLRERKFGQVPYAFNVLATATKLLQAEQEHGKDSEQYRLLHQGFYLDSKRHRDEARRRLTWEYFGPVEQQLDLTADSYIYGGYRLREVVDNGLSPVGSEEVGIEALVANRREEHTSLLIGKLSRLALEAEVAPAEPITMITVSQIDTSPQTMIWGVSFDPVRNVRHQEQIGFTKQFITNKMIVKAYQRKEIIAADAQLTEKEMLDIQAINTLGEGVLDFMKLLDEIASEDSGKNIFMGEEVADDFAKDYSTIPAEAAERQAKNEEEVDALMAEVIRLARADTDGWLANKMIDDFMTNMLLKTVENDPQTAYHIFGLDTALVIEESMRQRSMGNVETANLLLDRARAIAPLATVCTGGSCGIEEINRYSAEGQDLAKKLKAGPGDKLVKDKVRTCVCGSRNIAYAYNSRRVNKYCRDCNRFESKTSIVSSAK